MSDDAASRVVDLHRVADNAQDAPLFRFSRADSDPLQLRCTRILANEQENSRVFQ